MINTTRACWVCCISSNSYTSFELAGLRTRRYSIAALAYPMGNRQTRSFTVMLAAIRSCGQNKYHAARSRVLVATRLKPNDLCVVDAGEWLFMLFLLCYKLYGRFPQHPAFARGCRTQPRSLQSTQFPDCMLTA